MDNRTAGSYNRYIFLMFYSEISHRLFVEVESILKSELNDRNITFEAQVITTDFELALLKASK